MFSTLQFFPRHIPHCAIPFYHALRKKRDLPFVAPVLQALRSEVGNAFTVLGFVDTPWTLAAYAVEGKADKHCMETKKMMPPAVFRFVSIAFLVRSWNFLRWQQQLQQRQGEDRKNHR